MKNINTLIEDVKKVLVEPHKFSDNAVSEFAESLAKTVINRINPDKRGGSLRLSNLGKSCDRELYYDVNAPELGEDLPFEARMKFLFGDILEELLIFLAKEAGHTVTGQQDQLDLNGIKGHRDAVIDGMQVDVKSASSISYKKFKDGLTPEQDSFGYLTQQNNYLEASQDDPLLTIKDKFAFFVIDKQLGHIHLDIHEKSKQNYRALAEQRKEMVLGPLPDRGFSSEEDGKSGNRKLGTKCSYCSYKKECWPMLRTFLYSNGPRYLTRVERLPDVPEV